jgi:predicted small secreted protein
MYLEATNIREWKRPAQQFGVRLRQEGVTVIFYMEAKMRYLLFGLLVLVAAAALLTAGCQTMAEVPAGKAADHSGDVAEVVVTAERPARLMPEVLVTANLMPEVVVYATWSPATLAAASPLANFVN